VVTGSFNSVPGSEPLRILLDTGLRDVSGDSPTTSAAVYPPGTKSTPMHIDYILLSPGLAAKNSAPEVRRDASVERISDHCPLIINLSN